MPSWIGPWEIMLLSPAVIGVYVALAFYLMNAQTALSRCSSESRTMAPRLVWLEMIPVFGLVWQFFVTLALSRSLGTEFRVRDIRGPARPGRAVGIAAGVLSSVAFVFLVLAFVAGWTGLGRDPEYDGNGVLSLSIWLWFTVGMAGLVVWIVHWVSVAGFSSRLVAPQWALPYGPGAYPGAFPWLQPPYAPSGPPYSTPAQQPPGPVYPPAPGPDPRGDFCPSCGTYARGARFCPQCGRER